ncbi:polymer-forming cytoskeletal protein [Glaciimonas sp. PCH181]|uniref:polymer-forming cytoskeletal protein n=1 Tax=Glaciimonas sp. PCH181 TaxID=2133943 RepID=UPI000D3A5C39|nr:polymer-forming cytoskeletal protein [Glaciimonas sp. PCH181]PUA18820.1 hypothetical protein C7W93_02590 [Glaciimonas sp. PCH181]
MWTILFILFVMLLFTAPLLPALRELLCPSDIEPLNIDYDHDRSITRFARKLAALSRDRLDGISLPDVIAARAAPLLAETEKHGPAFLIVTEDGALAFDIEEIGRRMTDRQLVAEKNLMLPDKFYFTREVYAVGNIQSGVENHFRALFSEGNVLLRARCEVSRWVHATRLHIGPDVILYGRASADEEVHFLGGGRFERLNAPRICFGDVNHRSNADLARASADKQRSSALERIAAMVEQRMDEGRIIASGDLILPANSVLQGDLVVRGKLRIGAGALVNGSIKAYLGIQMEAGVTVHGAVVSAGRIVCGIHAVIDGPIISEQAVLVGHGSRIGSANSPTSVSAPVIKMYAHNTIAYGTLWARVRGMAVNRRAAL